jgi:hypothetical protein
MCVLCWREKGIDEKMNEKNLKEREREREKLIKKFMHW